MRVFRLSRSKYADELSGKGAALSGNRWNSKGTEIIYTAEGRALALAEVAVHLSIAALPKDFMMITIDIPDSLSVKTLDAAILPENWNTHPPIRATQQLGDEFIFSGEYALLKVPSAVVMGDFNFLINPHHADFKQIKIASAQAFPIDRRLF